MQYKHTLALITSLTLAFSCLPAAAQKQADTRRDKVKLTKDLEYAKVGDTSLKIDVMEPTERAAQKLPAIVFIHGGGWAGGDKVVGIGRVAPLVATGEYVGFTIQYRFTKEAGFPAQIHDSKAAIRWVKANAEKYGVDPDRIGVWGSSAGGHLVSLLGTSGDVSDLEGEAGPTDVSSRVKCVVNFCGPTDFSLFPDTEVRKRAVHPLLGGSPSEKPEVARQASPATYVSEDDPAFLIMHGTADTIVPVDQATTFHEKLKKAGVNSTLVLIEGGQHSFGGAEVNRRVSNFFAQQLLGKEIEVSGEPIQAQKQD